MVQFITAVSGERYEPLASVLLQSIREHHPCAPVIVVYNNVSAEWIAGVEQRMPRAILLRDTMTLPRDPIDRIPLKLRAWRIACFAMHKEHDAIFLDADMALVRNIQWDGSERSWDIGFTYKTHACEGLKWPLNTGIIISRLPSVATQRFLRHWLTRVNQKLYSLSLRKQAISLWGAADQAALGDILGTRLRSNYESIISYRGMRFHGFPCYILNQTICEPINEETQIIHYKGSWHPILLSGGDWSPGRPKEGCYEQYQLWLNYRSHWQEG